MHSIIDYVHKWTMVNIFKQVFNPIWFYAAEYKKSTYKRYCRSSMAAVTVARQQEQSSIG